ncbi:TetR family transcriptional regulator [Hoyosella rhizosphaerae]|uniref:TetR family transcriptional regulator n=1 Tax=Hoyosella rhizosphaerae TaxID=1755582 RepID=A0A916XF60_9ACTN|nr:TetR/AcrR family transcriptional regulator [Hoyosella rhizosphaerae]MBN4925669.1 TetR family transcriptional regulator [Hoyosella rhizosphaerae]GGC68812.1 TetR family transcriptional regulator [Hoyosella rhizosphaerae]
MDDQPQVKPSLRERKKAATMRTIQAVALDLFDANGYTAVTVDQIAEAAGVSPSSVYRYFGTKERLVLHDEYDPQLFGLLADADGDLADILSAMRQGIVHITRAWSAKDEADVRRRMGYILTEPDVFSAMLRDQSEFEGALRGMLAPRISTTSTQHAGLVHYMVASTLVGGLTSTLYYWAESGYTHCLADLLDEAMGGVIRSVEALVR